METPLLIIGIWMVIALICVIYNYKSVTISFSSLIDDTLKKDGKWSRTSLTMATAWFTGLYMAIYDNVAHGLNLEVFYALCAIALGAKVTDAWSKKINPTDPPKVE